jgi:hypothetical protein
MTQAEPMRGSHRERTIPVEYAMCRTFLHAWDYTTVKKVGREFVQGLVCLRCGTQRSMRIDSRTGERKGNRYDYPEKYVLEEGGALTQDERAALRLAEVKRHAK